MKVIKSVAEMRQWRHSFKSGKIGLVPTMGFLHEGHLSLIRAARERTDFLVVSIFVNPTQFAPGEDLEQYPRDFARDERLCSEQGVDLVFYPSNQEMYLPDHKTFITTEDLSQRLCGKSRPTHFRGVTTVVAKLFNIVQPSLAVFGQKDAQQALIIQRMVQDLNFDCELLIAPIMRETDGLALSSRNKYLSTAQRREATVLKKSLDFATQAFAKGRQDFNNIRLEMRNLIQEQTLAKIDYVEFTDAHTLEAVNKQTTEILVALAVYFGKTRLIDNTILTMSS